MPLRSLASGSRMSQRSPMPFADDVGSAHDADRGDDERCEVEAVDCFGAGWPRHAKFRDAYPHRRDCLCITDHVIAPSCLRLAMI